MTTEAEWLADAKERWSPYADKVGLTIVDADEATISVNLTLRGRRFKISKTTLRYVRDVQWPFDTAKGHLKSDSVP